MGLKQRVCVMLHEGWRAGVLCARGRELCEAYEFVRLDRGGRIR
jgi:hypothetical protein